MKIILFSFVSFTFLCLCVGCDSSRPQGFPDTIPFSLTVKLDNTPLARASIELIADGETTAHTIVGETDDHGIAVLRTVQGVYVANGAPEGNFKVVVTKSEEVPEQVPESERAKFSVAEFREYDQKMTDLRNNAKSLIPQNVTSEETSPLTVEVKKGNANGVINIAKP